MNGQTIFYLVPNGVQMIINADFYTNTGVVNANSSGGGNIKFIKDGLVFIPETVSKETADERGVTNLPRYSTIEQQSGDRVGGRYIRVDKFEENLGGNTTYNQNSIPNVNQYHYGSGQNVYGDKVGDKVGGRTVENMNGGTYNIKPGENSKIESMNSGTINVASGATLTIESMNSGTVNLSIGATLIIESMNSGTVNSNGGKVICVIRNGGTVN